jgi:two-component system chemotaxis response regulator CheY
MYFCLVIDDSDVVRKVARKILESKDHVVIDAVTGEQGLEHCRQNMPDIILLDWKLRSMTSAEFLLALRDVKGAEFPQILYSVTEADPKDLALAYRKGINDYILKPYDRDTLLPKIDALGETIRALA